MTTSTAIQLDDRGLIVTCPQCGQDNRLAYERLNRAPRCARCATALEFPSQPIDVDNEELFEALISRASLPVLVDFWAPWCGPCKMVAPEVATVAKQGAGRWLVAKVNTEELPAAAARHVVQSIPLFLVFKSGAERARQPGAMPAAALRGFVERHL
jgi:thioredoxin 2